MLLSVVSNLATTAASAVASVTPSVSPSPVVHAAVTTAASLPASDHVHQLGTLALLGLTGWVASLVHSFVDRDRWSATVNRSLLLGYSAVVAVLDLWLKGQLHLGGDLVQAYFTVVGAATSWYTLLFLLGKAQGWSKSPAAPASELPVVVNP